jgi:hypothetical protein
MSFYLDDLSFIFYMLGVPFHFFSDRFPIAEGNR